MTAAKSACASCGTGLPANSKFCNECGAAVSAGTGRAEYKQVTVLFADVVHSMDIAATVGAERLREIMAELVDRSTAVVRRYGGTVDKFTGDGIMAVFGAPVALEDHAFRACLAAADIQREAGALAEEISRADGAVLQLRIGLNSGEVIAGEIGSGALGYTAIGEQVGMAQRMESAAPPGGVMLSESTARLVSGLATLGEAEAVHIKGAADPVPARRLLDMTAPRRAARRRPSPLVGRDWELAALTAMLDRAVNGRGCVVNVVGPPGIGKSRIVAEIVGVASSLGAQVFSTFCESHASEVPFYASRRLLRAALGIEGLADEAARARLRAEIPDVDPADLILLDDQLGIGDPAAEVSGIAPDARRRRLTALIDTIALSRPEPAVFVIEDAHWVDATSESLFADFMTVVPRTHLLTVITHRPEYQGALSRISGAQTIALAPLDDSDITALIAELLGLDPSVAELKGQIVERAAGNPFFAEEIVRDLADRGVLRGERGAYTCPAGTVDASVPPTLQAVIAARIDRLDVPAKRTLNAAAVIGLRFGNELLAGLVDSAPIAELIRVELVDQVSFTPCAVYSFRHPLIRAVAYQSQLRSDRAEIHRRVADAIRHNDPDAADENAALIAEHLQAAGDLRAAYDWHMRAGEWLRFRDLKASRMSWHRARDVADRLAADDPDRPAMRIAPRALLCLSTFRAGGGLAEAAFDELRDLATAADDKVSLAIGMAGQISALVIGGRFGDAARLATELTSLVESIGDPTLALSLLFAALTAKLHVGEFREVLRLWQRIVELADGDPTRGNLIIESPVAVAEVLRAAVRAARGEPGWRDDLENSLALCREIAPVGYPIMLFYKYSGIPTGTVLPDATFLRQTAEALEFSQRSGDDWTLQCARVMHGLLLVRQEGPERADGLALLANAREIALQGRSTRLYVPLIDMEAATEKLRAGDVDGAIELLRQVVDGEYETGEMGIRAAAVAGLVDALLRRGSAADVQEAQAEFDRLAAVPTDSSFKVHEVQLLRLRALLARARGDQTAFRDLADRYRAEATACGFEGHVAIAETMA